MSSGANPEEIDFSSINRAFSKQSIHYDEQDANNPILLDWRKQVYRHVDRFMKTRSLILELNAGTGIDALHFTNQGHQVHATDLADGMIEQIKRKSEEPSLNSKLSYQQCSFDNLDEIKGKYDYIFSNFGGLNCIDDLGRVTRHLPKLLARGGFVTWVVMPPVCPWEILWTLKGSYKSAFRRFHKTGVMAHVEGEYFRTYYHSLSKIKAAFGNDFQFISCEGLGALSPPPSEIDFPIRYPKLYQSLKKLDKKMRTHFPFNRWADHLIVTFKKV